MPESAIKMAVMVLEWYGLPPKYAESFILWRENGGSLSRFVSYAHFLEKRK